MGKTVNHIKLDQKPIKETNRPLYEYECMRKREMRSPALMEDKPLILTLIKMQPTEIRLKSQ